MSKSNSELAAQVARSGGQMTPAAFEHTVGMWFKDNKRKMMTMAGSLENAQKIVVALVQTAARTPKIMSCAPESVFAALMNCAALQLFPGPMQECAIVPFNNRKSGKLEAVWMPMYQGLCKLAFNSGHVRSLSTEVVYEADEFDYQLGSDPFVKHRPWLGEPKDRGERVCVYCCIKTLHGTQIVVKSIQFCESIKARSPGARASDSPWNGTPDDYDAMCRKTVLKQGLKTIPKSAQLAQAIELDNTAEGAPSQDAIFDFAAMADRVADGATAGVQPAALEHSEQETVSFTSGSQVEMENDHPAAAQNVKTGIGHPS